MTRTCPQCAADNPSGNRFCARCGFNLEIFGAAPSQEFRKVCAGCGAINEPSFAYCYRCGLALPPTLHPRAQVGGSPAGFWIRFQASYIDGVVVSVLDLLLFLALPGGSWDGWLASLQGESFNLADTLVSSSLSVLYYTLFLGAWGRTPGKALLGLKVTRTGDARLSYIRAFARFWAYFVSALPLGLGFLSIPLSAQKRGWHDFLCDTRVVNTRKLG